MAPNEVVMPEAPAPSSDAAPNSSEPSSASTSAPSGAPDGVAQLGAALQALQGRYDELLVRFLTLVEERRALDRALMAERFKATGLERDLRVFQREWDVMRVNLTKAETRNEHHKELALKLQRQLLAARAERDQARTALEQQAQVAQRTEQELQEIRRSRAWQISQTYWKLARQAKRR